MLVDAQGEEKGTLEVVTDDELKGLELLSGDWKVVKV